MGVQPRPDPSAAKLGSGFPRVPYAFEGPGWLTAPARLPWKVLSHSWLWAALGLPLPLQD